MEEGRTNSDQPQTPIKRKQQPPPAVFNEHPTTFYFQHLAMKHNRQSSKYADENLLKSNAAHVNMYS